ncbi:unnamed protein product [Triticum turgidum subsp. durum]|uniref:Uncharacterized protein n=2 Tax=Triticum TaxID=4564 RepID=A0A9R1A4L8_TRITD|nr:unnamed protein product [Triticum turgidum subsp. durum]
MRKAKRSGDHLTRSFLKSRRASKNESLVSGCFIGDSDQGVRSGLSDRLISYMSKSVVSITLYNEGTILFSCSGIAMERKGCHLTRFLTSASLVRALNGTNEDHDDLKIEVRHEGNEVYMGVMAEYDLDRNFAVVNVDAFLDVQVQSFQHAPRILPHGEKLVVMGRDVNGEIMTKNVESDGDLKAWEGGPLLSVGGKVVGMNLFLTTRRAVFLPCGTILKHLEHYWTSQQKKTGLARFGARPIAEKSNSHPEVYVELLNQEQFDLDSMGYPKLPSSMLGAGMILVNTFEETFGDIHGEGVWRKFSKRASNINHNVVALASFSGEKRVFACTGFFIEWNGSRIILTSASLVRNSGDENKIVENLRIEVLLNNSQCIEGTLQHYSLHYNVALVTVKDYPAIRPLNTLLRWDKAFKVAAVGRCFKSGVLMATSGDLVSWTGTLDCNFLSTSTCKITKAGIGGPLVSLDGDVIGMNFYDKRIGTPFLFLEEIFKILALFETKSKLGEAGNDSDPSGTPFLKMDEDDNNKLNRWPVPMPCWRNPDYVDEDKSDDDDVFDPKSGRTLRYGYFKGKKVMLF